jgi:hypothetical protein
LDLRVGMDANGGMRATMKKISVLTSRRLLVAI